MEKGAVINKPDSDSLKINAGGTEFFADTLSEIEDKIKMLLLNHEPDDVRKANRMAYLEVILLYGVKARQYRPKDPTETVFNDRLLALIDLLDKYKIGDVDYQEPGTGNTAIAYAMLKHRPEIVDRLFRLGSGADPTVVNSHGMDYLMFACARERESRPYVICAVRNNVPLFGVNDKGLDALSYLKGASGGYKPKCKASADVILNARDLLLAQDNLGSEEENNYERGW